VPVDDENTLSVAWFFMRVPKGREPFVQTRVPTWRSPIKDANGRWITSHVMNQDFVAWVGQGTIADRTQEHLGESDRGVIMIRKRLLDDLEAVAAGKDPMATIRDPAVNHRVPLPIIGGANRLVTASRPPRFPFLAGQPAEVQAEFEKAWQDCAAAAAQVGAGG